MAEKEESYCRLCAEPTQVSRLISVFEEVGAGTKIITKLQWINIDVSNSSMLPTSICFACFDSLERTWIFLNEVRNAQNKLNELYKVKNENDNINKIENAGKPIDTDWEGFKSVKEEVKSESDTENVKEVKSEPDTENVTDEVILSENLLETVSIVKVEKYSDNEINDRVSTDGDVPLQLAARKNKLQHKKQNINGSYPNVTWEYYMCRCAYCDAQCKNIMSLRLHSLQIHTCCCAFKCSDCGKIVSNYKSFISHVRQHNKKLRSCCEYCNERFTLSSNLKEHKTTTHPNIELLLCQMCGAFFETPELLQDHLAIYTKESRRRAVKLEINDFKCNHCQKQFKSRCNLQQHMPVHTDHSIDFSCHICGKMFFTKDTLSTHITTHEETKLYKCDICMMAFRAKCNLVSHISRHSGLKPFVCEQCGKSFRVKRHLKSHSITHTDLRPYICEYCQRSFRFKTRLNHHLLQHTGAKPYRCVYCQREFANGSNCKKHMKRMHNMDTSKKRLNNIVSDNTEGAISQM